MKSDNYWVPLGNFRPKRYRPGGIGNWSGHLPFAKDLIVDLQPKLLVELGTHFGESYFGFCQAIAENNVSCVCYAVDNWKGEPHAGYYDESVYADVSSYNAENYATFSYLLRTTFDEAHANFSEDSIDILHIDGLHTHEAVSRDFHTWLPKVKPGGVVLIHDIASRHSDFGVWRLWEELEALGLRFAFTHSWGLGVFQKPGGEASSTPLLDALFHGDSRVQDHIRSFYSLCALRLEYEFDVSRAEHGSSSSVIVRTYPFGRDGYTPVNSPKSKLTAGAWQKLQIELLSGLGNGPLRIDFAEQPAIIDISTIEISRATNNEVLWAVDEPKEIAALEARDMTLLASQQGRFCRYVSTTSDPQLFVPRLDRELFDQPLRLQVWVRVQTEISSFADVLRSQAEIPLTTAPSNGPSEEEASARRELERQLTLVSEERDSLVSTCKELEAKLVSLTSERGALIEEKNFLFSAERRLRGQMYVAQTDLKNALLEQQKSLAELDHCKEDCRSLRDKCQQLEATIHGVLTSRSWRLTAPLRDFIMRFRGSKSNI